MLINLKSLVKKLVNKKPNWLGLFFLGVFLVFFMPVIDTDLGWHLRYGDYFWQEKKLLTKNVLTVFLNNYQWSHSYGMYQIITSAVFKLSGFWGLSFLYSLVFLSIFYLLFKYFKNSVYKAAFSFWLIVPLSWGTFNLGWRAQAITFLGIVFLFYLFKKNKLFILPLVFLFWVNLHGAFVLGIIIFFVFLLIQLIKVLTSNSSLKKFSSSLFIFFVSLITTFFNPYTYKVWLEAWPHSKVPMKTLIAEWVPPMPYISFIMTTVFFLCLALILFEKKKNSFNWFLLICLFMFLLLSLYARRNVPFFWLNTTLLVFNSKRFSKIENNINFLSLGKALILITFFWGLFFQLPRTLFVNSNWLNYCQTKKSFPNLCPAVSFIKKNHIKGNFYNTYEWGGFLEWQLAESKFFVDGRMPAWPSPLKESPYTTYLKIIQAQPHWQNILKKYKIDYLFISKGTFLDLELKNNKQKYSWQEIYQDKNAVIYKNIYKKTY